MKIRNAVVFSLLVLASGSPAIAADDDDDYNEFTIRPGDIPRDAPRFENYPAKRYTGKSARAILDSDPATQMYRTRIKAWSREKPNFAGHFILAMWGCGAECVQLTIIDAISGKVFRPAEARSNVAANVHMALLEDGNGWPNLGSVKFSANSNLLILIGAPNEETARRGISYYVWNGSRLSLIRYVHKAWYPDRTN